MSHKSIPVASFFAALILALPRPGLGQTPPPGTDIWVMELRAEEGVLSVGNPMRITDRPGYDNQPFFPRGGDYLLYTSIDDAGQADIYRYVFEDEASLRITHTSPESEYSATIMPDGGHFSVVRVEADSTQRLWSFSLAGSDPRILLPNIAPVGYHAWIDEDHVALFVLGSPATLQIASIDSQTSEIVAEDIGRSIHKLPRHRLASFLQWEVVEGERVGVIKTIDIASGLIEVAGRALPGNEFYAWTPDGVMLSGEGSKIYSFNPVKDAGWQEVADLASAGISGISRLAVSPEGDRLAVVGAGGG